MQAKYCRQAEPSIGQKKVAKFRDVFPWMNFMCYGGLAASLYGGADTSLQCQAVEVGPFVAWLWGCQDWDPFADPADTGAEITKCVVEDGGQP